MTKPTTFKERYKSSKSFRVIFWVALVLILAAIGALIEPEQNNYENSTTVTEEKAPDKWEAYAHAVEVAHSKYGKADYGMDGAEDMGDGDWIITGHADIPGKRIVWTGEVVYNKQNKDWHLKGWTDR